MNRLWIGAGAFLAAGIVLLLVPIHVRMTGAVLILLGAAMALYAWLFPRTGERFQLLLQILVIAASAAVVVLMAAMNLITAGGRTDWDAASESEYAVVLGAAVRTDGTASRVMRSRLEAAAVFMEENPDAVVILSGGQGPEEPVTEAQCMYATIVSMGADPARLILEEESHTTLENFRNSMEILDSLGGTDQPVAVITSEFHQRRAAYIAGTLGLDTCPVSARTDQWFLRVNYTLREVFAVIKAAAQSGLHPGGD